MIQSSSLSTNRSCATLLAMSAPSISSSLEPIEAQIFENGFSYDFLLKESFIKEGFNDSLLPLIAKQMKQLIDKDIPFELRTMTPKNAQSLLDDKQPIQASLLETIDSTVVQICKAGSFYDLYLDQEEILPSSGEIKEFAIYESLQLSLFYPELGDVSVVRIRGAAFEDKKSLKQFLKQVELAKKNNPVQLMNAQDLGHFESEVYEERLLWHPNGVRVCLELESVWKKECLSRGFEFTCSPTFQRATKSEVGVEGEEDLLTSADIPKAHMRLFEHFIQQKKPLPYRLAEFGQKETKKLSKECDGLFSTKSAKGDSLHILCTNEQFEKEIISSLQFMQKVASMLGLECHFVLRYSKTKGTEVLIRALSELGISFEKKKDVAIQTGPKIELCTMDLKGRAWPISVIWIDYELPKRMKLSVQGVFICQSMILSCERVIALLLEKHEGCLPFWLTPEQMRIFLVESSCAEWAKEIQESFCRLGVRARIDEQAGSLSARIYEASQQKVPVGIVVGQKELKKQVLNVRLLQQWQQSAEVGMAVCAEAVADCSQSFGLCFDIQRLSQKSL